MLAQVLRCDFDAGGGGSHLERLRGGCGPGIETYSDCVASSGHEIGAASSPFVMQVVQAPIST